MSSKTVQFGPFTPQELDSFVRELQLKNIPFEIQKEEGAEKRFTAANDFSNIVNQVEFRTEQYLAQIFYITLARKDLPMIAARLERLGFPTEIPESPEELQTDEASDIFVRTQAKKKTFQRRLVAAVLVVGLLCLIFLTFASVFFEIN